MTVSALPVTSFDPQQAPPEQRLAVGQLLTDAHAFAFPHDPPRLPEREARDLGQMLPDERQEQFVVWQEGRAAGWGNLTYDTVQNVHLAHAQLIVHPDWRRQGIATALAQALEHAARQAGRLTLTFMTNSRVAAAEPYARRLGAEPALPMRQSQLDLHAVPADLLADWQRRPAPADGAGEPYRLHVWQAIPDAYLERAADLMMVMNTAPRGDLDQQDWVITPEMVRAWETMMAESGEHRLFLALEHAATGQLDGYTETFWTPERATLVYQGATAVRPSARGLGLGKWLKAAMLAQVPAHFPGGRWVRTNNANVNEAMLGINVALGFEPWAEVTEWQLRLPPLDGTVPEESGLRV